MMSNDSVLLSESLFHGLICCSQENKKSNDSEHCDFDDALDLCWPNDPTQTSRLNAYRICLVSILAITNIGLIVFAIYIIIFKTCNVKKLTIIGSC